MRAPLLSSSVVTATLVLLSAPAQPRTWYITPDGSGDAPTIRAGVDSAAVGDTVLVACGTYYELGIGVTNGLNLVGETGAPTDVVIDSPGEGWILRGDGTRHSTVVSGMTLTHATSGGAVRLNSSYTFRFERCVFRQNSGFSGAGIRATNTNINLWECVFEKNVAVQGGAIYVYDGWGFITNSAFLQNTAAGGGAALFAKWGSSVELRRCVLQENVGGDIRIERFSQVEGSNCTFFRNHGGFYVTQGSGISLKRSIIAFIPEGFVTGWCSSTGNASLNCCDVYGNAGGNWVGCLASQQGINGNFSADPLFCDPEVGDLSLAANSPCLLANNSCGVLIGALGQGCGPVALTPETWARVKARYK